MRSDRERAMQADRRAVIQAARRKLEEIDALLAKRRLQQRAPSSRIIRKDGAPLYHSLLQR